MPDLNDGETAEVQGSAAKPYIIKNVGGVYSCSCPAWRNQSLGIERRTCKHLKKLRGEAAEAQRIGQLPSVAPGPAKAAKAESPRLLLAETWNESTNPAGWYLSEKLDGVRAWWDGKLFWSRNGNIYHAPDWFVAKLPKSPLDGELWLDRKSFQRTISIVRRQDQSDLWREVSFVVFDAPTVDAPFEGRLEHLADCFAGDRWQYARVLQQVRCTGVSHMREELARIEALGGEGLMLREPASRYEGCRSSTLLKVKSFQDAEARVIEHQPGAGRHKGRLGALRVELPDGTVFCVGTGFTDAQRDNPPPIGSTITFRYQELTDGGVPRFPSFVGVRQDVAKTS